MIETRITPRSSELNAAGHIGGTALPVWFEEGCQEFLRTCLDGLKFYYFQARLEQDFRHEIFHGDDVIIKTGVQRIGNSSVSLGQEVWQLGRCCAEAVSVLVYVDRATKTPASVPDDLRACLERHLKS